MESLVFPAGRVHKIMVDMAALALAAAAQTT